MTIGVAFSLPSTADSFLFSIVPDTSARSSPISATLSRRPTDDQKLFLFASCSLSRNVRPPGPLFLHPHAVHAHSLSTLHDRCHALLQVCLQPSGKELDQPWTASLLPVGEPMYTSFYTRHRQIIYVHLNIISVLLCSNKNIITYIL